MRYLLMAVVSLTVYCGIRIQRTISAVPNVPELKDTYWGPGEYVKDSPDIKPFKISFPESEVEYLKSRLNSVRGLTEPLENSKQHYGMNTNFFKLILKFWTETYNFQERIKYLNKFPMFTTAVQGLNIHFLHVKPENKKNKRVLPLLLLHGWPGSVREFYEMIPMLTTPKEEVDFVFEVIAPSLPGYGFSDGARKQGLAPAHIGTIFKNLMKKLGHGKFYVQGGDWGALITQAMAATYPEHILGLHTNMCAVNSFMSNLKTFIGSYFPSFVVDKANEHKMYPLSSKYSFLLLETGYMHLQATKPDTIGIALNDSPAGLAAYILEKFSTWTEPAFKNRTDSGLSLKYKYEDLLDNVMIYYISKSITTSVRLYAEAFNSEYFSAGFDRLPINVPSACARFTNELLYQPDSLLKERFINLVHSSDHDGGHFAAFEVPTVLAHDIWIAVKKMEEFNNTPKT